MAVLAIGVYANALRLTGGNWPQWMDGRYGGPAPWGMFADGLACSTEVIATVQVPGGPVEVGRGQVYPGPGEWFWTIDDSWHAFAWGEPESLDLEAAADLARAAAGVDTGEVSFVLRERISGTDGVSIRDLPPGTWLEACA